MNSTRAKAILSSPTGMNNTEKRYADGVLTPRKLSGEILQFWFEAFKLRLADRTWYTPDFLVMLPDGVLEFHEVKGGFIREDSMIKLKIAASMFPFRFLLVQQSRAKDPFTEKVISSK